MTIVTTNEHKIRNGQAYVAAVSKNVAAGGTLNIHLDNPSGDDTRAVVTLVKVSSPDGKATINRPFGFTIDSTGTAKTVENKAIGASKTTSMNVYQDSTHSGTSNTQTSYAGTGTGGAGTVVGANDQDVSATVLSGEDMIISVTNPSGSNARDIAIRIEYYETSAE